MSSKILTIITLLTIFLLVQSVPQAQNPHITPTSEPIDSTDFSFLKVFASSSHSNDGALSMFSSIKNIAGVIVMLLVGGLASAGGGSGGALYICILIVFFTYSENQCVQIVYGLVFAGALGNVINVARHQETKTKRPLIDYDLGLLLMPSMAFGNNIGVILSKMAAPVVILGCLYLMLIYTLYKFIIKLKNDLKRESEVRIELTRDSGDQEGPAPTNPRETFGDVVGNAEFNNPSFVLTDTRSYPQFPIQKIAPLVLLLLINTLFLFLRGTKSVSSIIGTPYCGAEYWGLLAVFLGICLVFAFLALGYLSSKGKARLEQSNIINSDQEKRYPILCRKNMIQLNFLALLAGVIGGLLGIGGVMVINPTLLTLGYPTEIVAATSTFLILQTSLMALIQTLLYDEIPISVMLIFMAISLIGGFMVSFVLKKIIEKYRKPVIILIILVILVVLSMVVTPVAEMFKFSGNYGELIEFVDAPC